MNYFLVFQNKSYSEEHTGGYLWAPQKNKFGQTFHHWNEMQNVNPGDVIFNSYKGKLVSVIIANYKAKEEKRPVDLDKLELWHHEGWKINVEYIDLPNPISYKDHMADILKLQGKKYAPFNMAGRGNTGYLFRVTEELANFILEKIEEANSKNVINNIVETISAKSVTLKSFDVFSKTFNKTEKEIIIKSRIGHSLFKNALIVRSPKCALCGVKDQRFLIASHIKPWSESSDDERLDPDNGLLLCPNHDSLFDRGLISFVENGEIVVDSSIESNTKLLLNINDSMKIDINEGRKKYLKWHREEKFNKGQII